nr:hypothetical protein [Salinicola peritrichatus]
MNLLAPRRIAVLSLTLAMTVALSGCGTLFYPERKGQLPGRVDPGVAIADGVGLLFFIIPGVIAYAIDFSNNTIYLPGTHDVSVDRVKYRGDMNVGELASLIETRSGRHIDWHSETVRVTRPGTLDQALAMVRAENRLIGGS